MRLTTIFVVDRRRNPAGSRLHEKLSGKTAIHDETLKILPKAEPKVKGISMPKLSGKSNRGYVIVDKAICISLFLS